MGAWGYRTFENDDASDWVYELAESNDSSILESALGAVLSGGYLEAPECCNALAAAEVVAALNGKPNLSLPEEVLSWVAGKPKPGRSLLAKANQALSTILNSSELQELWADSDDLEAWQSDVKQIQARLR